MLQYRATVLSRKGVSPLKWACNCDICRDRKMFGLPCFDKKKYAQCSSWDNRKDVNEYNEFLITHESDCIINHIGSAGKMKCDGIVACFESFVESRKLQYTEYLGDGDSKSYALVVQKNPYLGQPVNKLECVGHIQKRVGSSCRKMKQDGIFRNIYSDEADPNTKRKKLLRLQTRTETSFKITSVLLYEIVKPIQCMK